MKSIRKILGGLFVLLGFIALLNLLHAQEAVQGGVVSLTDTNVDWNSMSDLEVELKAVESVPPMPANSLPSAGTYWSAQHAPGTAEEWPPLPTPLGMGAWSLGNDGVYLLDDLNHAYASPKQSTSAATTSSGMMTTADVDLNPNDGSTNDGGGYNPEWSGTPVDTNGLWLQIFSVSNGTAYLALNHATDQVYEVMSRTNLIAPGWQTETELWPTNGTAQTNVLPFTVPVLDRTNALFFRAMDWTGVTHGGNTVPDWWFWEYFGTTNLSDMSADSVGHSLLHDYQSGLDPNVISFTLAATNNYVSSVSASAQLNVTAGWPSYMALVVNAPGASEPAWNLYSTNNVIDFSNATWQAYNANPLVPLYSGDGRYDVWVGLRGLPANAQQTWVETTITLDTTPPYMVVTGPGATVSQPVIQVTGYANENLSSLTYDVSNAAGIFTNQAGSVTDEFYDTNLLMFTTNWFQCYDVALTNGLNRVTIHARDMAGNTATTNVSYTLNYSGDHTAPALTVLWPTNGTLISGTNFTLQARVDDDTARVTASIVTTNGQTNTVSGLVERSGAVWFNGLPLSGGTNSVTLTATDAAGNASVTTFKVAGNDVGLVIDPISSDQFNQSSVTVTGSIGDPADDCVWVNGVQAYYTDDAGDWEADSVPVSPSGTATLSVQVYEGDPVLIASQTIYQLQSVTVGIMSYSSQTGTHWVKPDLTAFNPHPPDGDEPGGSHPVGGPAFLNDEGAVNWAWQSGGSESGYDVYSGYITGGATFVDRYDPWSSTPLAAGQDAYGAPLWENTSTATSTSSANGGYSYGSDHTVTRVMIEPTAQQGALGGTMLYRVRAQASGVAPTNISIRGVALTDDGDGWGEMTLAAAAGANVEVTPVAPGNYTFNVQAFEADGLMAVDNNRDGNISFDNSDETSAANPYRFWINDSQEHGDDESGGGADDQIPGVPVSGDPDHPEPNYEWSQVQGRSDVVNFFPVALNLTGILQQFPLATCQYHLSQADGAVKFVYTSLTPGNAFDYLTDTESEGYGTNSNEAITNADTIQVTGAGMILNTNWLAMVQANGGKGVILMEGCTNTTQPLNLEIWQNGSKVADVPLYLSISGVEQMFRHANFCYINGTVTVPARTTAPNEPATENKNLVFVHGYNVNQQEARGVESEMFKRFYWSGSHARFYGVTWNGAESQITAASFTPNYHTNFVNASETAQAFATFHGNLSGQTVVAAHSLGNMVVLSAISDYGATPSAYFMIDAAVPIEAVQGDAPQDPNLIYPDWMSPQDYGTNLYASSWWQLFPTNDARSTLTWQNRLGNLGSVDVYNFYSSGEEVLREYTGGTPPSEASVSVAQLGYFTENWSQWFQDIFGSVLPVGTYTWQWQEMLKGRGGSDTWIGSMHGGWAFNLGYYTYYEDGAPATPMPAGTAASLPNSELQTNAFFDFTSEFNGYGTDTADLALYGSGGSAYATANRDRILSDAIPALTLPVGANPVPAFDAIGRNFNMQDSFQNGWPAARLANTHENNNWHHSDFDYVAYPFTHGLFDEIVNDGNLY